MTDQPYTPRRAPEAPPPADDTGQGFWGPVAPTSPTQRPESAPTPEPLLGEPLKTVDEFLADGVERGTCGLCRGPVVMRGGAWRHGATGEIGCAA